MTRNLKLCGEVKYKGDVYRVWRETPDDSLWVSKPGDDKFGLGNYSNIKARSEKEALELAPKMLESAGF